MRIYFKNRDGRRRSSGPTERNRFLRPNGFSDSVAININAASGFEIAVKHRTGKLHLPIPPQKWISEIIRHHQIEVIDLDLPPVHKDPCDRFIIATALIRNIPVVTAGRRFSDYGVEVLS